MVRSMKNFLWILVSTICLLTSLFFVGCGQSDIYENVSLSVSSQSISMYVDQTIELEYTIENYFEGMDNTIEFTIVDASSSASSSEISGEHVSLKFISKNDATVKVEVTGISSGRSSIIATTKDGYKQCITDVTVLQYSKTFYVDQSKVIYVTLGQRNYISNDHFVFDEGTTEKNVKYYYVQDEEAELEGKEFTSVYFYENAGAKTIAFLDNSSSAIETQICAYDGQYFTFLAVYTYKEIDETGAEIEVSIKELTKIVALFGIDENDVQIYDDVTKVLTYNAEGKLNALNKNSHEIELVANKLNRNSLSYYITVPTVVDSLIEFGFDYSTANKEVLSLEARNVTNDAVATDIRHSLEVNNLLLYRLTVTASTFASSINSNLNLKVYYKLSEYTAFSFSQDERVNYSLDFPIHVKLMPEKVEIVDSGEVVITSDRHEEGNTENEIFYNFYVSDYGWVEYHVNVYKPSSSFSGVKVTFNHSQINIIYDGKTFNSTYSFVMTDLSKPLYIRGVDGIDAGTTGSVNFEVISDLFEEGESLKANLNYIIQDGASVVTYKTPTFDAKTGEGVYISSSSKSTENVFVDLYADKNFEYFVLEAVNPGIVSIGNLTKQVIDGRYHLSMEIAPIKVGETNYIVRLDNGVSTTLKIKVVNTFDNLSIDLSGTNPDVVSFEKTTPTGEGVTDEATVVVRNSNEYGKTVKFELISTFADSILQVEETFDEDSYGVCGSNITSNMLIRSIYTVTKGTTYLTINVRGRGVNKFILDENVIKKVVLEIISFVPVTDVSVYNINPITHETTAAEKVKVYAEADVDEENTSNTAYLTVEVTPDDAYYFYDVTTNSYSGEKNIQEYVFWTLSDGLTAFEVGDERYIGTDTMQYGKSYYISGRNVFSSSSYYGRFEFDGTSNLYKFTANSNFSSGATFTIYATIRQFGLKKYYPVQIECSQFVPVKQIYLNDDIASYSFKNADEKLEFTVYLDPYEATKTGIKCVYVSHNSGDDSVNLLDVDRDVVVTPLNTTTSRAYLVSVQLSKETVNRLTNATQLYAGTLYIVPNDWYNSNYKDFNGIKSEKLSQAIKIGINFQNGTRAMPYLLETAEDVVAIGSSLNAMKAHYVVNSLIDMSKVSNYPIGKDYNEGTFSGSIRGGSENAGFTNIRSTGQPMFAQINAGDGGFSLDNLVFSGNIVNKGYNSNNANIALVAGVCSGKVYNINTVLDSASEISFASVLNANVGIMFGKIENGSVLQDFSRNYITMAGSLIGSDLCDASGAVVDKTYAGTKYFIIGTEKFEIKSYANGDEYITVNEQDFKISHISKITVYSVYDFTVKGIVNAKLNVGAIAGQVTNGTIKKIDNDDMKHFNYSGYTVFAHIHLSGAPNFVAGGVAGDFYSGTIDNLLIGGEVFFAVERRTDVANIVVGGIVGQMTSGTVALTNITTRMAARGYTVGIIVGKINGDSTARTVSGIKVQATDDGKKTGIDASFITRFVYQSVSNTDLNANKAMLNDLLQGNGSLLAMTNVIGNKFDSYVTSREQVEYYTTNAEGKYVFESTTTLLPDDKYYGDALLVLVEANGSGRICAHRDFDKVEAGGLTVAIDPAKSFSDEIYATYVYRYNATAYYDNGKLIYSNLIEKQGLLDEALNTIYAQNGDMPFEIDGESASISSKSKNISIDANGNIFISGTGLAEIDVTNMLNQRNVVKIYLYVINYFNAESYINGSTKDLFYINTLPFRNNTEFNVISENVYNVVVNPYMTKEIEIGSEKYAVISGGIIGIDNVSVLLDEANDFINYEIEFTDLKLATGEYDESASYHTTTDGITFVEVADADKNPDDFFAGKYYIYDPYAQIERYEDGFFFSKKSNVNTTADSFDRFNISAYLSIKVGGEDYKFDFVNILGVKAKYYEGATSITSNYSSYTIFTGKEITDTVIIQSDTDENLCIELQNEKGEILHSDLLSIVADEEGQLFKAEAGRRTINENTNCFDIKIEVNKLSQSFKDRFKNNIYGTYFLKIYSTSHGQDGIHKLIKLVLEEQSVKTITMTSFNNLSEALNGENGQTNEFVVPNQAGLLTISISPIDADFDYILVENADMNYELGSSSAALVAGYIEEVGGKDTFIEIGKVNSTSKGIQITKEALEQIDDFSGTFYVKYLFGTYKTENDSPVQIKASVHKDGKQLCYTTGDYKINIQYQIGLKLNGYENKTRVARGLSYELEVINTGYNPESLEISIPVEQSNVATLIDADGNVVDKLNLADFGEGDVCKLQITNNMITYVGANANNIIEIKISVTYIDSLGVTQEETQTLELEILEYVINYNYALYEANDYKDIISGMTNGIITTAIGEKTTLSVDFNNYKFIEYNPENTEVKTNIEAFIADLNSQGEWYAYIDVNSAGDQVYQNPIVDETKAYKHQFGKTLSMSDNIYFTNSGLSFRTKRTHSGKIEKHYYFTYEGGFKIENGKYIYNADPETEEMIKTEFTFDSFVRGSEENPNPIETYDQLKAMNSGAHYILMNDIYITSENFEPIDFTAASFDGNGYKFIFTNFDDRATNEDEIDSVYDMSEFTQIGVFSAVAQGSVLKNVTVQIGNKNSQDVIFMTSSNAVSIGLVAVNNRGVITNACVENFAGVSFKIQNNTDASSIIGGIVANNETTGFITHSRSYLSIECAISAAGVVGKNAGYVASSFYKGGQIKNILATGTSGIYVAGFAVENSGKIVTSYTSGEKDDILYTEEVVWESLNFNIDTSVQSAGFVYKNSSKNSVIKDCYANLIISSTSLSAGFVFENNGLCNNDISYSLVKSYSNEDYGFAGGDSTGTFEKCFYIRSVDFNINKAQDFITVQGVEIKTIGYGLNEFDLSKDDNIADFDSYVYSMNESNNFVWYFNESLGRLELVDANIIAFSQKEISVMVENEDDTKTYFYVTGENSTADGSLNNPYVISSPERFESYLATGSSSNKHYRIVCDLDFKDYTTDFLTTYDTTFEGYLYGNGMQIINFNLYSDESLEYAGLFAKIEGQPTTFAFVKDLILLPTQITFVNANIVGGLAGAISYADITNVAVYGAAVSSNVEEEGDTAVEEKDENLAVVIGKNIVGGVVGLTQNTYTMRNIVSKISMMSKHIELNKGYIIPTKEENAFISAYLNRISYSGGIVGYLAGSGSIKNVEVLKSSVVSVGSSAGLMFGFVGKNATAENLTIEMNSHMLIRANVYGGIIAGGTYGNISNISIVGNDSASSIFAKLPYIPEAVGGVAGFMSGGSISNVSMSQSFKVPYDDSLNYKTVDSVGGIVGKVGVNNNLETQISNALINGSITAGISLGGVVGSTEQNTTIKLSQIAIKDTVELSLESRYSYPTIGGFVGLCQGYLEIQDSYSKASLNVDVFEYDNIINTAIGEIFGNVAPTVSANLDLTLIRLVKNVYTNCKYSVTMEDKSIVADSVTHNILDTEVQQSFLNQCDNVFNATKMDKFTVVEEELSGEARTHALRYSYVRNTGTQTLSTFASSLNSGVWSNITDKNGAVIDVELVFLQNN